MIQTLFAATNSSPAGSSKPARTSYNTDLDATVSEASHV